MSLEHGVYQTGYAVTSEIGALAVLSPEACAQLLFQSSIQASGIDSQDGLNTRSCTLVSV